MWRGLDFHEDGKVNYSEFLAATISSVVKYFLFSVFSIVNPSTANWRSNGN